MGQIAGFFKAIMSLFKGGGNWVFAVLMIISLFSKKKKQTEETKTSTYNSPTYSWDNISNTSDVDIPLPIIFGKHKVGGNIINTHIETKISTTTVADERKPAQLLYDPANNKMEYSVGIATPIGGVSRFDVVIDYAYSLSGAMYDTRRYPLTKGLVAIVRASVYKADGTFILDKVFNITPSFTATTLSVEKLDNTYINGYKVVLQYEPIVIKQNTVGYVQPIDNFGVVIVKTVYIYNKEVSTGTGNETSAQTLYMDIGLSVGQIKAIDSMTVNEQPVVGFTAINTDGKQEIRIQHKYKIGHDLLVEENINDDIKGQSSVFNENKIISKITAILISENAAIGATQIKVADNNVFQVGDYINIANIQTCTVTGKVGNDTVQFTPALTGNVGGGQVFCWVKGTTWDWNTAPENKGLNYDVVYYTKFDYVDALDLGVNAPNGVYSINDDGNMAALNVKYKVYVGHKELFDVNPLLDITQAGNHFYAREQEITGARRGRIWYNLKLDKTDLEASITGKRQYKILIRKITPDAIDTKFQYDLQLAYVEEIKNKDLYYNGLAYATLIMPADPRLNGGTPNFTFTVEGVRTPKLLHSSLAINKATSTVNLIDVYNPTNIENIITATGPAVMNTLALPGYLNIDECEDILYNYDLANFNYKNIVTAHFKVKGLWYKRFCLYVNRSVSPFPPPYYGTFIILNAENIAKLKANTIANMTASELAFNADALAQFAKLEQYFLSDIAWQELNQDLQDIPDDVIYYSWSDNPSHIILYLLTNEENGLNVPLHLIDIDSFRIAAAHYDEMIDDPLNKGRKMKRCELNFVIDTVADVRQHLDKILSTCHSSLFESNGKIKLLVDEAQEPVVTLDED
nr:hypothetical protein [Clostridia bacterium]